MHKSRVHFVGVGGVGMSALAQLFAHRGAVVSGSDRARSPITEMLERKGVHVQMGHNAKHVPSNATLLVYSDAVPTDNLERVAARTYGIPEMSYFEALGAATRDGVSIVVSGTHGKTTTTAMLAKILIDAGEKPTVIAGSILSEYKSNFIAGRKDLFIIEGCEYRRHFLFLLPSILIITNIELDHTDYYSDLADVQHAFISLIEKVPDESGVVVAHTEIEAVRTVLSHTRVRKVPYQLVEVPRLRIPGTHNTQNAQAAKAAALAYNPDMSEDKIDASLTQFSGTWRRFEYRCSVGNGMMVYDDYAHHPTAIQKTLIAMQNMHKGKKVVVAFHPHLYSRTRDFMDEFARALALADEVIVAPIYAAREAPIEGVTAEALAHKIRQYGTLAHAVSSLDEVRAHAETLSAHATNDHIIFLTLGAGDIYTVADTVCKNKN